MDPNQALDDLRQAILEAQTAGAGAGDALAEVEALREVMSAAEALDEWISDGGHLPRAWSYRAAHAS